MCISILLVVGGLAVAQGPEALKQTDDFLVLPPLTVPCRWESTPAEPLPCVLTVPGRVEAGKPEHDLEPAAAAGPRIWAGGEYLLWSIKKGPLSFPLVTTGNPHDPISPGALGRPGTVPLFGGSGLDYGGFSGMRVRLGGWFNAERTMGIEGESFLLERRSVLFSAGSNADGMPPLYVPVFRADLSREGAFTISDPVNPFTGGIAVSSASRLWGTEVNGVVSLIRSCDCNLDFLVGFRYADLGESLILSAPNLADPVNGIFDNMNDHFSTRNQFYGDQLGLRGELRRGPLTLSALGKLALGTTHQVVGISGYTIESGAGSPHPGIFPGAFFTQRSNIGRHTHNHFTVLPQLQLTLGYELVQGVQAFAGYDILYWNEVVRPGNQIDRSVNPTQILGNPLVGPARPAPLFDHTDFWVHGVSLGLLLSY